MFIPLKPPVHYMPCNIVSLETFETANRGGEDSGIKSGKETQGKYSRKKNRQVVIRQ